VCVLLYVFNVFYVYMGQVPEIKLMMMMITVPDGRMVTMDHG